MVVTSPGVITSKEPVISASPIKGNGSESSAFKSDKSFIDFM